MSSTSSAFPTVLPSGLGNVTVPHRHQGVDSPYNYVPTLWICALFVALFSLSALIHLVEAIYTRLWFMIPTAVLACITEVIGWSGRLWSSKNPSLLDPFLMQISTTIIAPTPLVAANFVILGQLITRLGPQYSRLSAVWYTVVFVSCDVIALVIQAVGGGAASTAVNQNRSPANGGHIMLAGIAFQLAAITIYMTLATEFILRFLYNRPVRKVRGANAKPDAVHYLERKTLLMLGGLFLSSLAIFIRSIYRTIELSDGWNGRIISTQRYFDWLDGGMITLATFTINIFHPGFLLGRGETWKAARQAASDAETATSSEGRPSKENL
ncbi:RTA1 domain-containing protein [Phanerochaete sordida]|uniref:RTA1 domain-containing protein n=1 Tax=Phanerochaete sordida TaxID=48140 RepID=A0A9P3L954_9APHY|nr:RTA1 domain-containing protein [Phanerochaete sordida]